MVANIIVFSDYIEINNVTSLKEFNAKEFILEINSEGFIIKGNNLDLKEVKNNNSSLIISGTIDSIEKTNKKKEVSFVKRLFA